MKKISKVTAALIVACLIGGASLLAHSPFVLPNVFSTSKGTKVTVVSSFTEEFFVPDYKMESEDFHFVLPDGTRSEYGNMAIFDQLTILENSLETEGTYRFSTGNRLGRKFKMKKVDGDWDYLRRERKEDGSYVYNADGAETADFQTQTVAVAYVTKGVPTQTVLQQSGVGLEIVPLTHPSEVFVDDGFDFQLTFNGEAVKKQEMKVYRQGGSYEEPKYELIVETNKKGMASIEFEEPGVYVVMTRYRDVAPEGAETPYRSYTTTLSFEVLR
ncbi:MAG: DUF4198 domain-containing protein [Verrucomicrobiota bacterium]